MILHVHNSSFYEGSFPFYRKPSQIGYFSLDSERHYKDDKHQLKYLYMPKSLTGLHMDLNVEYVNTIRKDFSKKENIDFLLKWILNNQDVVRKSFPATGTKQLNVDFVCYRGLLTEICATIYEDKEDWCICATKYNSVIYLCAFHTAEQIRRRENATERDKVMCSWGYKFEQYLSSDSPDSKPDPSLPCNEKEEYCVVLKGRLETHSILFSAELDGKDPNYRGRGSNDPESTDSYIELKTSRIITTERQNRNFCRYKLLKWWLQSFLAGIPKIICGFRDDDGIVKSLSIFHVSQIPEQAQNLWSPVSALIFGSKFLDFVKACVKKDDSSVVYKFYRGPGASITCEELDSPGDFLFLPEWYTANVKL